MARERIGDVVAEMLNRGAQGYGIEIAKRCSVAATVEWHRACMDETRHSDDPTGDGLHGAMARYVRKNEETGKWEAIPPNQYSHQDVLGAIEVACAARLVDEQYDDTRHFYELRLGDGQVVHVTFGDPEEDDEGEEE